MNIDTASPSTEDYTVYVDGTARHFVSPSAFKGWDAPKLTDPVEEIARRYQQVYPDATIVVKK